MLEQFFNVLFLCTGNSARSIVAESIINNNYSHRFKAYSAGSFPKGQVHPIALDILKRLGHNTSELRSKNWDEFSGANAPSLDFVFTVCDNAANETCPVWIGKPITVHWGIPDPVILEGSEAELYIKFYHAYWMLNNSIARFANLPLSNLDNINIQNQLRELAPTN